MNFYIALISLVSALLLGLLLIRLFLTHVAENIRLYGALTLLVLWLTGAGFDLNHLHNLYSALPQARAAQAD